ncbi:MAG TPA: ribosome silencing factor [Humisphaera sp.]|nr:ribosome silencing factor [Humisphaera sp.]
MESHWRWNITLSPQKTIVKSDVKESRRFAIDAARLLSQTRCNNVVVLDVTGESPVTDFLVIATGASSRQMKTACDDLQELGAPRGFRPMCRIDDNEVWICIDLVDIVVHLFTGESRLYYDLENFWADAKPVSWEE